MFASLFILPVKQGRVFVLAALLALGLAACGAPAPTQRVASPDTVTEALSESLTGAEQQQEAVPQSPQTDPTDASLIVAIMLPLTGPEEETGKALLRAATMALFDAYDPRLKILPFDTQADVLIAEEKAQEVVDSGAAVVLGPLLADNVKAVGPLFQQAGITMIGFSNDRGAAAPGRFIMGFLPEAEVKRVIDYAAAQNLKDFGALVPLGLYGRRVQMAFGDAVVEAGAHVAAIENYPPDPDALVEPVKRLARYDERRRDARREIQFLRGLRDDLTDEIAEAIEDGEVMEGVEFDAVLVPEGGALMRSLAPLLPFYEVDPNKVKLLGTGLWNDTGLLGEPPLQGAWFAAPEPEKPMAFLERFESIYGVPAPRLATLAYDAMALVAQLAREPVSDESSDEQGVTSLLGDPALTAATTEAHNMRLLFSPSRLQAKEGFSGIDGLFRFLEDGTIERALAVLEVNRGGFVVADPSSKSFPAFGYSLNTN